VQEAELKGVHFVVFPLFSYISPDAPSFLTSFAGQCLVASGQMGQESGVRSQDQGFRSQHCFRSALPIYHLPPTPSEVRNLGTAYCMPHTVYRPLFPNPESRVPSSYASLTRLSNLSTAKRLHLRIGYFRQDVTILSSAGNYLLGRGLFARNPLETQPLSEG
jgi:hypothetical protein